jgi:hypothetical protein
MAAVRLQTVISSDGTLTLKGLPALAGHLVDVIVSDAKVAAAQDSKYPLRGKPLRYERPFDSVSEADWEAVR